MSMDRRKFLGATLAGAGSLVLGHASAQGEPDPFQLRPLGETGLRVSLIGAGTGMRGWNRQSNQTRLGEVAFEGLLKGAFERGINLYDCADLYGTHPYIASAFAGLPREEYVVATKIWTGNRGLQEAERPGADVLVDRFRQELDTDYIDLVLLHCMTAPDWTDQQKRGMDLLSDLKSKGIVRAHGVSVHSLDAMRAAGESDWVDSVNVRINAYGNRMDNPDPAEVISAITGLRDAGKGVVGMKLIGEGDFRNEPDRIDASVSVALEEAAVDTMVVGFEKLEEIDDFAERVRKALLKQATPD